MPTQAFRQNPTIGHVIHTASPVCFGTQDPVKGLLDPAIKGTLGLLKSVQTVTPGVRRVVITSSAAAISNSDNHANVSSEAN